MLNHERDTPGMTVLISNKNKKKLVASMIETKYLCHGRAFLKIVLTNMATIISKTKAKVKKNKIPSDVKTMASVESIIMCSAVTLLRRNNTR